MIRSGQPLLLTPETLDGFPAHLRQIVGHKSLCWLGVPLNSSKGTIGALVLKSYCGGVRYGEKDKELLQFVSNQIATAIERHQLHARLRYMAQYDELTGLPNRGLLFDRLHTALARARREQGRLALLYLDRHRAVSGARRHRAGAAAPRRRCDVPGEEGRRAVPAVTAGSFLAR
ncbi:putative diguanylate cyclase [compost metagenome]